MKRHNGRIICVQALFAMEFNKYDLTMKDDVLEDIISLEKEEEYPVEVDFDFAKKMYDGVIENMNDIDDIISKSLVGYALHRLPMCDRNIIRLATYEMKYTKTPVEIVINEAIEITKEYSSLEDGDQDRKAHV